MGKQGLFDKLIEYGKNGNYGFHMPGHKRNLSLLEGMDPFQVDITEINGFDNLHHATGVIKDAMDNASEFFGTDRTWFLVNGSTCGILAAMNAVANIGDSIVVGRNCHKAVYHGAALRNLQIEYLYPEYIAEYGIHGGYDPEKLEQIFQRNKSIKAVVITSPTYDGIVSDIKTIAEITHSHGAVLIVDEAHGAHFGISDKLPQPAYSLGADLVIESVHKTLPSLTQTALLHLSGDRVSADRVEECLGIYQSSSPSYVLMGSIDKCIGQLQTCGQQKIDKLLITDEKLRRNVNCLKFICIPGKELVGKNHVFDIDLTKLVIYVDPAVCDGKELADILRNEYGFEMEMESAKYVLGITTICDDDDEMKRLAESLEKIDAQFCRNADIEDSNKEAKLSNLNKKALSLDNKMDFQLLKNKIRYSIYEAQNFPSDSIKIEEAGGRISGEFLYLYPPGIPLLVPGEVISEELLIRIKEFKRRNMNINGLRDKENRYIQTLKDK